jgi:hypothetical protein
MTAYADSRSITRNSIQWRYRAHVSGVDAGGVRAIRIASVPTDSISSEKALGSQRYEAAR